MAVVEAAVWAQAPAAAAVGLGWAVVPWPRAWRPQGLALVLVWQQALAI